MLFKSYPQNPHGHRGGRLGGLLRSLVSPMTFNTKKSPWYGNARLGMSPGPARFNGGRGVGERKKPEPDSPSLGKNIKIAVLKSTSGEKHWRSHPLSTIRGRKTALSVKSKKKRLSLSWNNWTALKAISWTFGRYHREEESGGESRLLIPSAKTLQRAWSFWNVPIKEVETPTGPRGGCGAARIQPQAKALPSYQLLTTPTHTSPADANYARPETSPSNQKCQYCSTRGTK